MPLCWLLCSWEVGGGGGDSGDGGEWGGDKAWWECAVGGLIWDGIEDLGGRRCVGE